MNRPSAARVEVREDQVQLERKAFTAWCRKGWDGPGRPRAQDPRCRYRRLAEHRGLAAGPETFLRELQKNLVEISPMRQVARVQTVGGTPVKLPEADLELDRRLGC